MSKQSKIVDLIVSEDGSYSPKDTKTKAVAKKENTTKEKRKYMIPSGVDEFLSGMDVGLDLLDAVKMRAIRIMGLRD